MRRSPLRTTLAVLRSELELSQEEFGKLISRSRPTIQAIELGKLRLTEDLAAKISAETGISARWLLEGDPDKPMINDGSWGPGDNRYNKGLFEHVRATAQAMAKDPGHKRYLRQQKRDAQSLEMCSQWFGILAAARKDGKQEVAEYLLSQFIDQMKKRFGYESARKRQIDL
jgi:DNA-binding XRE family transcriptional regulator